MAFVFVGLSNLSWPSRKKVKRSSLTLREPMVEEWLAFICCVRVA